MAGAPIPEPLHIPPRLELVQDPFDVFTAALEAAEREHRLQIAARAAEIIALRRQLLELGVTPVVASTEEFERMFRGAARVLRVAQLALSELGSSKEMLEDWPA